MESLAETIHPGAENETLEEVFSRIGAATVVATGARQRIEGPMLDTVVQDLVREVMRTGGVLSFFLSDSSIVTFELDQEHKHMKMGTYTTTYTPIPIED
jgi:hypothetical protein